MTCDPYAVLGLDPSASAGQITAAYRRLVRTFHPDVRPDPSARERFSEVLSAYATLRDFAHRAAYDTRAKASGVAGAPRPEHRFAGAPPLVVDPLWPQQPPLRVGPVQIGPLGARSATNLRRKG